MSLLSPLARSFAPTIQRLCALIAHHAGLDRRLSAIVLIVWGRLNRTLGRLDRLILRWQAGTLRPPRAKPATPRETVTRTPPATKIPTRTAWLLYLIPHTGEYYAHVESMVNDAEIAALAAAAPQAGRLLRPLCRMFGVTPPEWLALPKRARKPRAPKPPTPPRLRLTPISFTRAQIDKMTAAELTWLYGRMPPHFNLPIPNFNYIRRKIAAG